MPLMRVESIRYVIWQAVTYFKHLVGWRGDDLSEFEGVEGGFGIYYFVLRFGGDMGGEEGGGAMENENIFACFRNNA